MEPQLFKCRHSLAHLLAQAIQQTIDPSVALGTGPAVDDGFYYDVLFSEGISFGEPEMKELTKTMQGLIKQNQSFVLHNAKNKTDAEKIINLLGGSTNATRFKKELIEKFHDKGINEYTFYLNVIPAAAVDKLLAHAKPGYKELYTAVTNHFIAL